MRNYAFTPDERPTMANFNQRFQSIADLANGLGNEYVWSKNAIVENRTVYPLPPGYSYVVLADNSYTGNVQYADEIAISKDGEIALVNPTTTTTTEIIANRNVLLGKYFINPNSPGTAERVKPVIVWVSKDAEFVDVTTLIRCLSGLYNVSYALHAIGYVNSPDPSAYPPSVPDGYTYTALGQLGEKVRIATGSYTGAGTYGSSNPNSLTFDFVPKVIFIVGVTAVTGSSIAVIIPVESGSYSYSFEGNSGSRYACPIFVSLNENTVYWYSLDNEIRQMNRLNVTYRYTAIG